MSVDVETNAPIIMEKEFMKFSTYKSHREPVECSDSEENENETQEEEQVVKSDVTLNQLSDGLSNLLEKCTITEKRPENKVGDKKVVEEGDVCTKLSQVSLNENSSSDNGSVEVVVERIKKEGSEDNESKENDATLSARGPNGGVATNYCQPQDSTNYFLPMEQNNFMDQRQNLNFNTVMGCCQQSQQTFDLLNNASMFSGKRRPDEDGDMPYKFRAPEAQQVNNPLNIQHEKFANTGPMCGGALSAQQALSKQVENLQNSSFDFLDDISNLLETYDKPNDLPLTNESLNMMTRDKFSDTRSEGYASPDHESQYSPIGIDSSPPPSNISEDSGIAASPDNSRMDVASPASMGVIQPVGSPIGLYSPPSQTTEPPLKEFWEQSKDQLADVLSVVAKDLMEDKKMSSSKQKGMDHNSFVPNKQVIPNGNSFMPLGNIVKPQVQQDQQAVRAKSRTQPILMNNKPVRPVITAAPVTNQVAVSFAPIINNTNSQAPVTASQIFLLAPQPQSVLVVNQTGTRNTQPTPKKQTTFKPILPKLDPVPSKGSPPHNSPSSSPRNNDIKSRVPVTVTAAARETVPDPRLASIQPSKTPPAPANIKPKGSNSPPESRKLNFARRLVANMTSKDLRFQDSEGDTYLHVAACKADTKFVQAVLERLEREKLTGMVHVQNSLRQTTLYCAVGANNPEMVELLIRYGADVNDQAERVTQDGMAKEVNAAIHVASSNGKEYLGTLQALLKAPDIKIDKPNSEGQTALHCAMLCHGKPKKNSTQKIDSTPIIETLIQHNADINAQDMKSGKTPFMYALESKSLHLISLIAKYIKPENSRTYLRTASFDGNTPWKIIENLKSSLDSNSWQKIYDMVTCTNRGSQNMGLNNAPRVNVCY